MFGSVFLRLFAFVLASLATGCVAVRDPSLDDPTGADVASVRGSVGSGKEGVDVFVAAVDDQIHYAGRVPTHERRIVPGRRRLTIFVSPGGLVAGLSEFSFEAGPRRRYEVRARKRGGFFLMDLIDVSNPAKPVSVLAGKFGAVPLAAPVPPSPFIVISPE